MRVETGAWAEAVDFVGWALLHSLWQGAVLALAVATALVLLRDRSAAVRYAAAYSGLVLLLALPACTAFLTLSTAPATPAAISAPAATDEANVGAGDEAVAAGRNAWGTSLARGLDHLLPWLVAAWFLGIAVLSLPLTGGWWWIRRLRRGAGAPPKRWQRAFRKLAGRLGVNAPVRLGLSPRLQVPVACGWLRPMVLVPVSLLTSLPPAEVESILAHELAHVRRNDYPFNLLQGVIEILLFYHPAVWWVSGRVREEREHCCDDLAVAACGDPRIVARALADLEALRTGPALASPALAATDGSLLTRVRRLVAPPPRTGGEAAPRLAAVAVLTTSLLLVVLPSLLNALPVAPADPALSNPDHPLTSTAFSFEDEMRVEATCEEWEKVRRCVVEGGHGRFECAPRSPLAAMLAPFREPQQGDPEVRVEVRRPTPVLTPEGESGAALPIPAEALAGTAASETVRVQRKVGELPACRPIH